MSGERERHIKRLLSLAEAVREASKRLPDAPVSAEVVACAGIMGMANWLEDVVALLRAEPVGSVEHVYDESDDCVRCGMSRVRCEPVAARTVRREPVGEPVQGALNVAMDQPPARAPRERSRGGGER